MTGSAIPSLLGGRPKRPRVPVNSIRPRDSGHRAETARIRAGSRRRIDRLAGVTRQAGGGIRCHEVERRLCAVDERDPVIDALGVVAFGTEAHLGSHLPGLPFEARPDAFCHRARPPGRGLASRRSGHQVLHDLVRASHERRDRVGDELAALAAPLGGLARRHGLLLARQHDALAVDRRRPRPDRSPPAGRVERNALAGACGSTLGPAGAARVRGRSQSSAEPRAKTGRLWPPRRRRRPSHPSQTHLPSHDTVPERRRNVQQAADGDRPSAPPTP